MRGPSVGNLRMLGKANGSDRFFPFCFIAYRTLPSLDQELVTDSGESGWILSWHNMADDGNSLLPESLRTEVVDETNIFLADAKEPLGLGTTWGIRLRCKLRARPQGVRQFEFGLTVTGRGKLFVEGNLVIDNWTKQRQGEAFFGLGTQEEKGVINVTPGSSPEILVEFSNVSGPRESGPGGQLVQSGLRLGGRDVADEEEAMQAAVECARAADVAVVVVGLNSDWESEGYDRRTLALPARTDELVKKVALANPRTVVVTQSVGVLLFYVKLGFLFI